jgi:hypothetical protein
MFWSQSLLYIYSECLTKGALKGSEDFKIGGKVICTTKYAVDLVLLAKEEKVLQGTTDGLIETGSCYGVEKNVDITKVMRIPKQPSKIQITIKNKRRMWNV